MPYPAKATLEILAQRLATSAKVPAGNEQEFCDRIIDLVLDLRKRTRPSRKPGGRLIEAAEAARVLDKKFTGMNDHDRKWVDEFKRTQGVVFAAGKIDDLAATITNIAMLLHDALGKSYPVPKHFDVGRHTVKDQGLRELVFGLLSAASETGGKFTFNKNSLSGSLATALSQLRPHLPPGLVPNPLLTTTIQRLKDEFERLRKF
jgi:hypothetical protein